MQRTLTATGESWPLARPFAISRGTKTAADVVLVDLHEDGTHGRGEAVPYKRYGETVEGALAQIASVRGEIEGGLDRQGLLRALAPGAARNALDCALIDLEAKRAGVSAAALLGLPAPPPVGVRTCNTVVLGTPEAMGADAGAFRDDPILKVKLGGTDIGLELARIAAVVDAAPGTRLLLDPNEGWSPELLARLIPSLDPARIEAIEQPLPTDADDDLRDLRGHVPFIADEACHTAEDLPALRGKYDIVNVKLDKSGGLTAALALVATAETEGFGLMVGCMVATSLAIAPALLIAARAQIVDLDGPVFLKADRPHALQFQAGRILPAEPALWG